MDDDVQKKTVFNQLVTNFNTIDTKMPSTSGLITKTQINMILKRRLRILAKKYLILVGWSRRLIITQKITEIENKISSVTRLVTIPCYMPNTEATKTESKVPVITLIVWL